VIHIHNSSGVFEHAAAPIRASQVIIALQIEDRAASGQAGTV